MGSLPGPLPPAMSANDSVAFHPAAVQGLDLSGVVLLDQVDSRNLLR